MCKEQSELEFLVLKATKEAIHNAVQQELVGYNKPLTNICNSVIGRHEAELTSIVDGEVTALISADDFRLELKDALKSRMAKLIVGIIGGELEKRVNELKANPTTRAKIILALNQMVTNLN